MTDRPWLEAYPPGVPADIDTSQYASLVALMEESLQDAVTRHVDTHGQRLDRAASRLGRPSGLLARQQMRLGQHAHRLRYGTAAALARRGQRLDTLQAGLPQRVDAVIDHAGQRLHRAQLRLELLDPRLVLQRGYAWLSDAEGHAVTRAAQVVPGQPVRATLADGEVALTVAPKA